MSTPEPQPQPRRNGFDVVLGNPPWVRQELLKPIKPLLPVFESFASTADSSVYFLELASRICSTEGRIAMLTPNKWFRANYAENLRRVLRQRCQIDLVVDFGHSRMIFDQVDTFPAVVVMHPIVSAVADSVLAQFVRAHDSDRNGRSLHEIIHSDVIDVPHGNLRPEQWHFEDAGVRDLLDRLMATGRPLEDALESPIRRGLLSGYNEAFYVDTTHRDAMVAEDPASTLLFHRFLRGRDVGRWVAAWAEQWHIVIPSGQNCAWPWTTADSEGRAEEIFAATYPSVHAHLKQFEEPLRARQDKGNFWWELRSCDYYREFESPKIIVQCIAYYSQFAFDERGHYVNNKVIVLPTDDLYVLAILNSRIAWWLVNRTFQHMKDEGLSVDVQFLKQLPIPDAPTSLRGEIALLARQLVTAASSGGGDRDTAPLEVLLNDLVERAFALTAEERAVLLSSLPPRDPIQAPRQLVAPSDTPAEPASVAAAVPALLPPTRTQVQKGRAPAYLTLLAATWAKPVERQAIEYGLVLMLNDSLRAKVLAQAISNTGGVGSGDLFRAHPSQAASSAPASQYVQGLDAMIGLLNTNNVLTVTTPGGAGGIQRIELGSAGGTMSQSLPPADWAKAKEAVAAFEILRTNLQRMEAFVDARDLEFSVT